MDDGWPTLPGGLWTISPAINHWSWTVKQDHGIAGSANTLSSAGAAFMCRPAHFRYRSDLVNGKLALGHDNAYGVVFSPDGKHIAYPAGTKEEVRIIHDGKPGPAYQPSVRPYSAADGRHLAYVATVGSGRRRASRCSGRRATGPYL